MKGLWVVLALVMLLVIWAAGAATAEIMVQPIGIATVAPEGLGGLGLSLRTVRFSEERWLWVDLGAITPDLEEWHGFTGLSTEVRKVMDRGGFGYDWADELWLLYLTKEFSSVF